MNFPINYPYSAIGNKDELEEYGWHSKSLQVVIYSKPSTDSIL